MQHDLYDRLKRIKALTAPAYGLMVAVVDGHETHATRHRCCAGCLERTVHTKDGEITEYYHRLGHSRWSNSLASAQALPRRSRGWRRRVWPGRGHLLWRCESGRVGKQRGAGGRQRLGQQGGQEVDRLFALAFGWPNWRGSNHDGVSQEKIVAWPAGGPKRLWKVELGPAHSSVAIQGNKVYTMGRNAGQDIVYCLNADTGETIWKHEYRAKESSYGRGPRATPAVDGNAVYTLSADGQVFCLDAASGKVIWNKDLVRDVNVVMPRWLFGNSPIIEDRLVLLNAGESGAALDKKTGEIVWRSGGESSYSLPVPFSLGGRRCMALFAATQLLVADPVNGRQIAALDWKTRDNANCSDPLIVGDKIFIAFSYGCGCAWPTTQATGPRTRRPCHHHRRTGSCPGRSHPIPAADPGRPPSVASLSIPTGAVGQRLNAAFATVDQVRRTGFLISLRRPTTVVATPVAETPKSLGLLNLHAAIRVPALLLELLQVLLLDVIVATPEVLQKVNR
ncbi:MAG: PQQ-binding-like beta-propeller repeat protein [Tepidisphaeraceae bacterium]|jgi:hypothetical protein